MSIYGHDWRTWTNPDDLTVYWPTRFGSRFSYDALKQDVVVRTKKDLTAEATTTLDWYRHNFFNVSLGMDTTMQIVNPRENSDFVVLFTKDNSATTRTITWGFTIDWGTSTAVTTLSSANQTKLVQISYFEGVYRGYINDITEFGVGLGINPIDYGAIGDGTTDDTTALNAAAAAWRSTFDSDWAAYKATLNGSSKAYRVTAPLNFTNQSNNTGVKVIRDLTIHADMSGGIVMDMTGSRGVSLDGIAIETSGSANTPVAGIVYQRKSTGANVDGQMLRNVTVKGTYSKTCLHNYGSEVMNLDSIVLQNDSKELDAYCLSITRTDSHFAIASTFETAVTGAVSSNRRFISNMQCFRSPPTSWTITAITNANPAVCSYTVGAAGIAPVNGDIITIELAAGMTEINQGIFTVANVNTGAGTFELSGTDSTAYGVYTSGASVFYQTGPAVFLDPDDRLQAEHLYVVTYGNDGIHLKPTLDISYLKIHGHLEGASAPSWIHFEPGTNVIEVDNFDFYDHRMHTPTNVFRCTASGAGKMTFIKPKISCSVWTSTVTPTGKMFANPDKFYLYDADITVATKAYMNDPSEFGHFSGKITYFDTGEQVIVRPWAWEKPRFLHYYDDFDGFAASNYWNKQFGTDATATIVTSASSSRTGRLLITAGDDAAGTLAANGSMLNGQACHRCDIAGIDVEFAYGVTATQTNVVYFLGLTDQQSALEIPAELAAGDTITPYADDFVGFLYDTAADAGQEFWHAVSRKGAGTSQKLNLNVLPQVFSATDYERLRIEVDTSGNAVFYIDDVQVASFTNAVTATVTLAPVAMTFARGAVGRTLSLGSFQILSGR